MNISHVIEIEATASLVWRVTTDIERWPEWQPNVEWVRRLDQGALAIGSRALVKQRGMSSREWTVTELDEPVRFTWETRSRALGMTGSHMLEPSAKGTFSHLQLALSGPAGVPMWLVAGLAIRWALAQENRGLKQRCETADRGSQT